MRINMELVASLCLILSNCFFLNAAEKVEINSTSLCEFDGTTTYQKKLPSHFISGKEHSIEFLIQVIPTHISLEDHCLISFNNPKNNKFQGIYLTKDYRGIGIDAGNGFYSIPFNFSDEEVHHVAIAVQSNNSSLYIDGEYRGTIHESLQFPQEENLSQILRLGSRDGNRNRFSGQLGELRFWQKRLTANSISKHINSQNNSIQYWSWNHPHGEHLIAYSVFDTEQSVSRFLLRYSSPIVGMWVEESNKLPELVKLPSSVSLDGSNFALSRNQRFNHGNYKAPPVYSIVPNHGKGKFIVFRDANYFGKLQQQSDGTYLFSKLQKKIKPKENEEVKTNTEQGKKNSNSEEQAETETLTASFQYTNNWLISDELTNEVFGKSEGERIRLSRPISESDSFQQELTVNIGEQLMFDQIAQLYPANYKCYNLKKMDPLNPVHTRSGSNYYVFQLPSHEFKVSSNAVLAPKGLHVLSRREGGGGSQTMLISSEKEMSRFMSLRAGVKASGEIMGTGGGFSLNASTKEQSGNLSSNESSTVMGWSSALSYALISDKPHLKLHPDFRRRLLELYHSYRVRRNLDSAEPNTSIEDFNKNRLAQIMFDEFFEEVGTNFPYAVTYGGLMMIQSQMSKQGFEQSVASEWDIEGSISGKTGNQFASGEVEVNAGYGEGENKRFKDMVQNETWEYSYVGGGGMLMNPEEMEGQEIDKNVTPVYMDLRPIEDLLSPQFFSDPEIYNDFRRVFSDQRTRYLTGDLENSPAYSHIMEVVFTGFDPKRSDEETKNFIKENGNLEIKQMKLIIDEMAYGSKWRIIDIKRPGAVPGKRFSVPNLVFPPLQEDPYSKEGALVKDIVDRSVEYDFGVGWSIVFAAPRTATERQRRVMITASVVAKGIKTGHFYPHARVEAGRDGKWLVINDTAGENEDNYKFRFEYKPLKPIKNALDVLESAYNEAIPALEEEQIQNESLESDLSFMMGRNQVSPRELPFRDAVIAYWTFDGNSKAELNQKKETTYADMSGANYTDFIIRKMEATADQTQIDETESIANNVLSIDRTMDINIPWPSENQKRTAHWDFYLPEKEHAALITGTNWELMHRKGIPLLRIGTDEPFPIADKALRFNTWHKLIISEDLMKSQLAVMIDGQLLFGPLELAELPPSLIADTNQKWNFEDLEDADFQEQIAEMILYNRILSAEEMLTLSLRSRAPQSSSPDYELTWMTDEYPSAEGLWVSANLEQLLVGIETAENTTGHLVEIMQAGPLLFPLPVSNQHENVEPLKGFIDQQGKITFEYGPHTDPAVLWAGELSSNESLLTVDASLPWFPDEQGDEFIRPDNIPNSLNSWQRFDLSGKWIDLETEIPILIEQQKTSLKATFLLADKERDRMTRGKVISADHIEFDFTGEVLQAGVSVQQDQIRFANNDRWLRLLLFNREQIPSANDQNNETVDLTGRWIDPVTKYEVNIVQEKNRISVEMLSKPGQEFWKNLTGRIHQQNMTLYMGLDDLTATVSEDNKRIMFADKTTWVRKGTEIDITTNSEKINSNKSGCLYCPRRQLRRR